MTTEERLAKMERELATTRRRSRWLLVDLALGLGALALVWASAASAPRAEAQGAEGRSGETQQWPLMLMQKAAHLQALREKVARVEPESQDQRVSPSVLFKPTEQRRVERFDGFERLLLNNALDEARLAALAEARSKGNQEDTARLLERANQLENIQRNSFSQGDPNWLCLWLSPEQKTLVLEAVDLAKAVALAGARAGGNEIRANRFVLEDEHGEVRGVLAVDANGASLGLFDENGKPRAALVAGKGGSALILPDENGKIRARLGVVKDGPAVELFDENGKTRALLVAAKDRPGLGLFDAAGKMIWSAP